LPPATLVAAFLAAAAAPLLIAGAFEREADGLTEAGVAAGVVALATLLLQFVSSGRFESLSGRVGIDRTMRFHQLFARTVLALALAHVLLLALPGDAAELAALPARLGLMVRSPHMLSGVIALAAMVFLVAAGIFRRRLPVRYELWRTSHALAALGAGGAALHHALDVGGYSATWQLRSLWWLLGAAALGSLLMVYVWRPFLALRSRFRVARVREVGRRIYEVVLEPRNGPRAFRFEAGQFAWVNVGTRLALRDHPFSIASGPHDRELRLLIKARGDFSSNVLAIPPGTPATVDGPHGNFTLRHRRGDALAFFAGGIGIAPILSLLRALHAQRDPRPIALVYGARNPAQLVCTGEIEALARDLDLHLAFFVEEAPADWPHGRGEITTEAMGAALRAADRNRCLCFVCGPPSMMVAVERELLALGVPAGMVVYERFEYD